MSRAKELRDELRGMLETATPSDILQALAAVILDAENEGRKAERAAICAWLTRHGYTTCPARIEDGEHLR